MATWLEKEDEEEAEGAAKKAASQCGRGANLFLLYFQSRLDATVVFLEDIAYYDDRWRAGGAWLSSALSHYSEDSRSVDLDGYRNHPCCLSHWNYSRRYYRFYVYEEGDPVDAAPPVLPPPPPPFLPSTVDGSHHVVALSLVSEGVLLQWLDYRAFSTVSVNFSSARGVLHLHFAYEVLPRTPPRTAQVYPVVSHYY